MSKKLRFLLFIIVFVLISLQYSALLRGRMSSITNSILHTYLTSIEYVKNKTTEHFNQRDEIRTLRKENEELKRSTLLSIAFAGKLNRLLNHNEQDSFNPKLALVESTSYVNLSQYNRVWIQMKDFNSSKIYGLTYQGNSAGIVVAQDGRPLALLQGDEKCIFSVSVGERKIPGVAMGKNEVIHVKYIPLWMNPKKGDKVITSGLDNIFFIGIPVGKVIEVVQEESYKTAIVKPNVVPTTPAFFYAIL